MRLKTLAYVAAGLALALAGSTGAATPGLSSLALEPSEIGSGYKLHQRSDGHGIKHLVTLDVCAFVFPSESLRTDRLQVDYDRTPADVDYSNEIVSYKPGKAAQAIAEVRYAARHCPAKPIVSPYFGGPAVRYRLSLLTDAHLLPGSVAIHDTETATIKGKTETHTTVAVYQVRGDVLSAVYAFPGKHTTPAELDRAALATAEASAARLREVRS